MSLETQTFTTAGIVSTKCNFLYANNVANCDRKGDTMASGDRFTR